METKITPTELARNLSDILNRVKYRGERFRVERRGETVAIIEPPPMTKRFTLRDLVDLMERLPWDDKFADDLEAIHNAQGVLSPPREWPS